jgi:hypothetical protein
VRVEQLSESSTDPSSRVTHTPSVFHSNEVAELCTTVSHDNPLVASVAFVLAAIPLQAMALVKPDAPMTYNLDACSNVQTIRQGLFHVKGRPAFRVVSNLY